MAATVEHRVPPEDDRRAVCLSLLGGLEVRAGHEPIRVPPASQRILALLAVRDRAVPRGHVAGTLWPETTDERASANLRSTLWRLPRPHDRPLVAASPTHLCLTAQVAVDYQDAVARATALLDSEHDPPVRKQDTVLLAKDLLPNWYEDWLLIERERFRQLRLHALEAASRWLATAGEFHTALQAALAAVAAEPLRESAHRQVIAVHLAEGNRVEAFRQYRAYRRLLADELGLEPSPALDRLVEDIGARPKRRPVR